MPTDTQVIETTGEVVGEERVVGSGIHPKDVPVYTVARAVEWMRRPENAPKIEKAAKMAGQAVHDGARAIDREVTKVGRLLGQLATDDDVLEDFKNEFLKSLFDVED